MVKSNEAFKWLEMTQTKTLSLILKFSKKQSLFYLLQISTTQHNTWAEKRSRRGMDCTEGSRPPKTLEAFQLISRKVHNNRWSMRTDLHNKWETYLQKGQAQVCVHPRGLDIPISWSNTGVRTGDFSLFTSHSFSLTLSSIQSSLLPHYPFTQNPLPCAYTGKSGTNTPIFMPSVSFTTKTL